MALDDITLSVIEGIQETASTVEGGQGAAQPVIEAPLSVGGDLPHSPALAEIAHYTGEQISADVIFANEGRNLSRKPQMTAAYARKLAETARVYRDLLEGRRSMQWLAEAMMSSEFSALLGDTMDRVLLARYATYAPTYRQFLRGRTVRDFRQVANIRLSGGGRLSKVREGTNYPQESLEESSYEYGVSKYGQVYELTWESIVNDDLDAFARIPDMMTEDAIQTEMYLASALYVANSTLYATNHSHEGATYSNTGTDALSTTSLKAAVNAMAKYPGDKDKPLPNTPAILVVPPALYMDAVEILGSLQVQWAGGDASASAVAVAMPTRNALAGMLRIVVDPYIPILDATNGHTSWYLFAEPARGFAAEYAFLRGYETPQMF
ncbi:MAG TPA: Mu-like prophage major head subunit gpT family protein, partial [Aggregatilinea sp.]|uniref:phage major capsid protein n=1 Tax=Aggregatilinea sp. TaxID=2806333 RepID=UPI002B6F60A3